MGKTIRVAMAEDHLVLRQGIIALLKEVPDILVVLDVGNGKQLLEGIPSSKPDVILLDIDMPVMGGREALLQIAKLYPDVMVIMLSMHFEPGFIICFLNEGARAFLPKGASIDEIVKAIRSVCSKGFYYDEKVQEIIEKDLKYRNDEKTKIIMAGLTNREVDVLKLLREGKTNAQIGQELGIANRTVEWHRQNLIGKIKSKSYDELLDWLTNTLPG